MFRFSEKLHTYLQAYKKYKHSFATKQPKLLRCNDRKYHNKILIFPCYAHSAGPRIKLLIWSRTRGDRIIGGRKGLTNMIPSQNDKSLLFEKWLCYKHKYFEGVWIVWPFVKTTSVFTLGGLVFSLVIRFWSRLR